MRRYLITGGAGFIGAAITKKILDNGDFVRVFDNQSRGSIKSLPHHVNLDFFQGDIRKLKDVEKACSDIEAVIHLAFVNGTEYFYTKPELVLEVGVKGIMNVLDACISKNIKELYIASSSEVYQTPPIIPTPENVPLIVPDAYNPRYSYGGGKIISELLGINYGRKYFKRMIIFRPHNVYGPNMGWEHVIPQLTEKVKSTLSDSKKLTVELLGTGKETRSFIYIDDFANCLFTIIKKGKHMETYNIGTSDERTMKSVLESIGKYYEKEIVIKTGGSHMGSTERRCPDVTKIKALGFTPKISFDKGLTLTVAWYDKNKKPPIS